MPDTGKGTHVSSAQKAAVIMAYLRSKSSAKRVKASVGSKTRSNDRGTNQMTGTLKEEIVMIEYKMDITQDELDLILKGLSDDGKISEEAEKALRARIDEGKAKEFPMGEVKRQFRSTLTAEPGKKIADAIDKLW